ncbi:hypothetical protein OH76DRAFT_1480665 [Lentinus brumalis]|uniref:Uncharacterized protein n=1 Tax=Lentinus brumalis TaxID=2498619 RepID=A0A371DJ62_9APHY|nr:hypothetical protein OH76DRAFT_1480665 [Polyporus brumalis]
MPAGSPIPAFLGPQACAPDVVPSMQPGHVVTRGVPLPRPARESPSLAEFRAVLEGLVIPRHNPQDDISPRLSVTQDWPHFLKLILELALRHGLSPAEDGPCIERWARQVYAAYQPDSTVVTTSHHDHIGSRSACGLPGHPKDTGRVAPTLALPDDLEESNDSESDGSMPSLRSV